MKSFLSLEGLEQTKKMIQRYKLLPIPVTNEEGMCPYEYGEWVLYDDHLAALTAERERADIAEAERDVLRSNQLGPVPEGPLKALGAWVADHTDDDTWPAAERYLNAALADLTAERERADRAEAALECGHPASLMLHSAETGEPLYCELCDIRSQRNDAVQMEEHYKARAKAAEAERDALRERVARLVGTIEDAPHTEMCDSRNICARLLVERDKCGAHYLDHITGGPWHEFVPDECNCWKRTALEGK